jgi:hypothetical protein
MLNYQSSSAVHAFRFGVLIINHKKLYSLKFVLAILNSEFKPGSNVGLGHFLLWGIFFPGCSTIRVSCVVLIVFIKMLQFLEPRFWSSSSKFFLFFLCHFLFQRLGNSYVELHQVLRQDFGLPHKIKKITQMCPNSWTQNWGWPLTKNLRCINHSQPNLCHLCHCGVKNWQNQSKINPADSNGELKPHFYEILASKVS